MLLAIEEVDRRVLEIIGSSVKLFKFGGGIRRSKKTVTHPCEDVISKIQSLGIN